MNGFHSGQGKMEVPMKVLDKRILGRMQEDERRQYEQELSSNLPDLLELSEFVDTHLLTAQLPSRKQKADSQADSAAYEPAEQQ
jgi:hypothetical protein